jgi:outer membrane immunogenic protein
MPALYNWSGIYIGVEGGAVMGQRSDLFFDFPGGGCPQGIGACANAGHPLHGGFVGGEAGVNWQAPGSRWVLGIEGDGQWAELEEALTCPGPSASVTCGSRIRDFETVRARIGYAFGPRGDFLVFVTGGWATANQSAFLKQLFPPFASFEQFLRHHGFAVGGGAEYGITPWLSLKAEVLYVWLEGKDHCLPSGCEGAEEPQIRVKDDFVLARMGLNWRFWWGKGKGPAPVVARY